MSGGVDSSVAAALLKEQGHEVIGLTMRLLPRSDSAIEGACRVCEKLGIPHHVADLRSVFTREIIDHFCREYSEGRTPNPCVLCNRLIKFGALWERAAEIAAAYIATGHYARVERNGEAIALKKGADFSKDQSYFLCKLTREQLKHVLFPVGHLTKSAVRQIATARGLPAAARAESQEICFIPDNDHAAFMKNYIMAAPPSGPIVDGHGKILGEHGGIAGYTIGQRHGLGIAATEPLYVTAIKADRNTVVVGARADTYATELIAADLNWIDTPGPSAKLKAKVRYRHAEAPVSLHQLDDNRVLVKFAAPQIAIAPGQTIAFYDGDRVLGGGTIIKQGAQL
jgi:tRNA-specific 2-thiouridylase